MTSSDPKIDPRDPKIDPRDPKITTDLAPPNMSVCTKFQVDSSKSFRVMLRKPNLTFVTSATLKIKVTTPKQIRFLGGLWGRHIPCFKLIAVKLFELLRGNNVFGQTDSGIT